MATLTEDLQACGLAPTGEPLTVTVDVTGFAVAVSFSEPAPGHVALVAKVAGSASDLPADALAAATRDAPGDTRFEMDGGAITGRRTLVEPSRSALRDTTFELAKLTIGLGRRPAGSPAQVPAEVPAEAPAAQLPATPFWFFVDQPTPLKSPQDTSEVLAMLQPGAWYEARTVQDDWVYTKHPSGAEGWIARGSVNPA